MNFNWILVYVIGKVIFELMKKPEKTEALKDRLVTATTPDEVNAIIADETAGIILEATDVGLPAEVVKGLVEAKNGEEVEAVINRPAVKGGILEFIGGLIGGIGKAIFGSK